MPTLYETRHVERNTEARFRNNFGRENARSVT